MDPLALGNLRRQHAKQASVTRFHDYPVVTGVGVAVGAVQGLVDACKKIAPDLNK